MKVFRIVLVLLLIAGVGGGLASRDLADAQAQTIKIGLLYDHTGPFAAGGSLNCWRGAKMMIDLINEQGGVARQVQDRARWTVTASPRPRSPSTRPSAC